MQMRSTANRAMARNMGPRATASEAEPALWVWTQEKDLESSLKGELLLCSGGYNYMLQINGAFHASKRKKNKLLHVLDQKPQLRDQTKNEPHIWNASDFIRQLLSSVDLTSRPSSNCACFLDRQSPHRPTNNPNASKFAQKAAGSDVCPRCGKTVYAAEKVIGAGNVRVTCVYSYLRLETQTCQFAVYSPPLCSLSLVLA